MRKVISLFLAVILLFNILGCSTIGIRSEKQLTKKQKYTEKEEFIMGIGGLFVIGGMILGGYVGNNLYPGKDMIKVLNITFGVFAGGLIFAGGWYLSVVTLENIGLLDTKISSKLFSDESGKK